MPLAFGHLLGAGLIGKLYEKLSETRLRPLEWGLLLMGGILPDADLLIDWAFGVHLHRLFTHSLAFVALTGLLTWQLTKHFARKEARPTYAGLLMMIGIMTHLLLDITMDTSGVQLLWPLPMRISLFGLQPLSFVGTLGPTYYFILDMALAVTLMFYLMMRRKLKP